MANRIKGITIELNGDSKKLQDSLKGVDSQLRKTETKLRDVGRLLKFNPGNTELLRQKQKALADAIDSTKKRLNELKSVQRDSVTADEWDAIQREIIETELKLEDLNKQMRDFGSVGAQQIAQVGTKIQSFGDGMKEVGSKLTKYVTGPIVAIGAASIAAFNEVDNGLDIIAKKTGATGKDLKDLQGIMEELATTIPTDFETAGTAIGEVSTRFGVTGDALRDLSGQYIKFAELNNTDVTTAIDSSQKALAAFGLGSEDASGLLDRLNKVAQDTGISTETLSAGLVTNATAFQDLGLSIDESAELMGQMELSGANTSAVMGGLRKALKNAKAEGKPLDQALSELQSTIKDGTGDVDGLTMAYELFGKSGDQIYAAIQNGTLDFETLGTAAEDAGGSVSDTFEETMDPIDKFKLAMNELKITGMELAETAMPLIQTAIEKLTSIISTLREKWESLSPQQQDAAIKIGLIVAAVGPLLMALGSVISSIGMVLTFAPAIATFLAGPIAPILAVGAVIAGLAAIVALNWDKIKAWTIDMVNRFKAEWARFKKLTSESWNNAKTTVINVGNTIKSKVTNLVSSIKSNFNKVKEAVSKPFQEGYDKVKGIIDKIKGMFPLNIGKIFTNLQLPKITVNGGKPPFGIAGKGSLPSFHVGWNAKGAIFRQPTIFATPLGYQGIAEAGAEAVLPLDQLWNGLRSMGDDIVTGIASTRGSNPTVINLYAYPSGPKMEQWVVDTYDRGKRRLG